MLQFFVKKNDRKRNEQKSWELTVWTFLALPIDCNTYILVATTVLGQRELYRPAGGPPVAQERKIYDHTDYPDYSPQIQTRSFYRTGRLMETSEYSPQVVPAAAEIATRGRLSPKQLGPSIKHLWI